MRGGFLKKYGWFLAGYLGIAFLLRFSSFYSACLDDDEGIYLLMGRFILEGHLPYVHYFDHQPPFVYFLSAIVQLFPLDAVMSVRFLGSLFVVFTASIIFFGFYRFVQNKRSAWIAGAVYCLLSSVKPLSGLAFNNEIVFNFFTVLSLFLILQSKKSTRKGWVCGAGFSMGFAFYTKQNVIFDFIPFLFLLMFVSDGSLLKKAKTAFVFILATAVPHLVTVAFYLMKGHLHEYFLANMYSCFGYISEGVSNTDNIVFTLKKLSVLIWLLLFFLYGAVMKSYSFKEKQINRRYKFFILFWFISVLYGTTLSKTFYVHYYLQLYPILAIGAGFFSMVFQNVYFRKRIHRFFLLFILVGFVFHSKLLFQIYSRQENGFLYDAALYLKKKSQKEDSLYVFDGNVILYFLSGMDIPSRFAFPIHLAKKKYETAFRFNQKQEFVRILDKKPTWIVCDEGAETKHRDFDDKSFPTYLKNHLKLYYYLDKEFVSETKNLNDPLYHLKIYKLS